MEKTFDLILTLLGFKGRTSLEKFILIVVINIGVILALIQLADFLDASAIVAIYYLLIFIPFYALMVRRIHDVGESGWYLIIPLYNLVLLFSPGQVGANDYGPDPKEKKKLVKKKVKR